MHIKAPELKKCGIIRSETDNKNMQSSINHFQEITMENFSSNGEVLESIIPYAEIVPIYKPLPFYSSLKPVKSKTNELKPLTLEQHDYISTLIEDNVLNLVDDETIGILYFYTREIENFFESIEKDFKLGIILQEDPEDSEFKAVIILINSSFENIREKIATERHIGSLIKDLRRNCPHNNLRISYLVYNK